MQPSSHVLFVRHTECPYSVQDVQGNHFFKKMNIVLHKSYKIVFIFDMACEEIGIKFLSLGSIKYIYLSMMFYFNNLLLNF